MVLTVIFVCYALFYIFTKALDKEKLLYTSFFMVILGIWLVYNEDVVSMPFLNNAFGRGYLGFFWGIILAIIFERFEERGYEKSVLIFMSIFSLGVWGYAFHFNLVGNINTTFSLCVCTSLIVLAKTSVILSKIAGLKIFRILGKASFSIYLWNFPTDMVFDLINRRYQCFDYSTLEIWGIHFVISLGVAIVSCYFLEPMLNRVFHKMTEKYL